MFAVRSIARPVSNAASATNVAMQTRNMATLKEIQLRLRSVQNIAKITKSMKMIASTKVAKAQRSMESARAFGQSGNELFDAAETKPVDDANVIYITSSSDRGLCGGIHSSVAKHTRKLANENPSSSLIILGDKAKAQLSRTNRNQIRLTFNQIGKDIPTYAEACAVADMIVKQNVEFDVARVVYNQFKSVLSYEAQEIPLYSEETFKSSPNFAAYEIEDDVLSNLQEFTMANAVYWGMVEGHAAEMASKRNAMESATKNAGEMIDKLTMTFNRRRQADITNELVDIITGASAL
ncbi:uncharacterized protein VTP21DRAFT_5587 [Calcarisporiella thermophila]|uniref:uncharacterized protein n=1 Tax=Calcarisporiella thermophila TaxID=911321 RepID=UPI0037446BB3